MSAESIKGDDPGTVTSDPEKDRTSPGDALQVWPPLATTLSADNEQAAIGALAELLANWRERRHHDRT